MKKKWKYFGSRKGQNRVREHSSYTIEIETISLLNLNPEKFWKYRIIFPYWSVFNLSLRLGLFYHVKITLKKTFAHVKKSSGAWAKSFFQKSMIQQIIDNDTYILGTVHFRLGLYQFLMSGRQGQDRFSYKMSSKANYPLFHI